MANSILNIGALIFKKNKTNEILGLEYSEITC